MSSLLLSVELWIWFVSHLGVGILNYLFLHKLQSKEATDHPNKLAIPFANLSVAQKLVFNSGTAHLMYAVFVITGIILFDWANRPFFQNQFFPGLIILLNIKYMYDLWIANKKYVVTV